jgi:hypothetical protein
MSCAWYLFCSTCNSNDPAEFQGESGRSFAHERRRFGRLIIGFAYAFAESDVEIRLGGQAVDLTWYTLHMGANHRVVIRNEYGHVDTCAPSCTINHWQGGMWHE